MRRHDFDVIVVGAGPGGASSAYYLAKAGLRILVVEKARWPRYKACGGAIPASAVHRLPFALDGIARVVPDEVCFTFPGLAAQDSSLTGGPVALFMRREFDAALLEQVEADVLDQSTVQSVVETRDGVRVQVGDRWLTADFVVGADGPTSVVARSLGLGQGKRLGGAVATEVPLDARLREEHGSRATFCFGVIPWGYAWIFPKAESLSVGIACFRPGRVDLRGALLRTMAEWKIDLRRAAFHGHPIPCFQSPPWPLWYFGAREALASQRCLLVGDAASLVDQLSGEGIRHALVSGRLAAEAITREDLSGYDEAIWRNIGHDLATAAMLARLFYRWPRRCYRLGVRNPEIVGHFIDLLCERAGYQGIGRRLVVPAIRWNLQQGKDMRQ